MKLSSDDIYFREMSEANAIKEFQDAGYSEYKPRTNRYKQLPSDGVFANSPATQFVAYYRKNDEPIGVIGYSKFQNFLLGSGVHIHKDYRKSNGVEGVFKLLLDKLLQEKGSKTMVISFAHPKAMDMYRSVGFKDINEKELPEEILSEIQEAESRGSVGALQKLKLNQWWMTIKRNSNFLIYRGD